jgi:hypothetical protein
MRRAIAPYILLLFLTAGCEKEQFPANQLPDSDIELTDGFCLVAGDQVVLNHHDIEYYDYSAQAIYLKPPRTFSEVFELYGVSAVYAGGHKIYNLSLHPGYSSTMPFEPIIWTDPSFYPDYIVAIDKMWTVQEMLEGAADVREDSRIVEALEKYGQFRHGLQCEITSITYTSPDDVEVELELTNQDEENYYYLDPGKMGMGLFHYFTNGLTVWDPVSSLYVSSDLVPVQPDPWNSFDMEWMSLLEGGSSVTLTIAYDQFAALQPGSYDAFFSFPGMHHQVGRDELDQLDGRIWMGEIRLHKEMVISLDLF